MNAKDKTLVKPYADELQKLVTAGLQSEASLEAVLTKIDAKVMALYKLIDRFAPNLIKTDTTPMSLVAEVGSDAIGNNTVAKASLAATIVERPLYSIALASAVSGAASDEDGLAFAATFTGVGGADLSFTKVRSISGANFEMSREIVVAIDFSFLEMGGLHLKSERNVLAERLRADVDDGNIATAEMNLHAGAESTAIIAEASVLTIQDFFSSSAISAELLIG